VIEVRSYSRVFALERRLYRIDRLRLNPAGVPVRGFVYFVALLAMVALLGALPLIRAGVGLLPWYLRDLALPLGGATLAASVRLEGRAFHVGALALARFGVSPHHLAGLRRHAAWERVWRPADIAFLPDGGDFRFRRLRYTGPGAIVVALEHERSDLAGFCRRLSRRRCRGVLLTPSAGADRGAIGREVIVLAQGARMVVRSR
jgi:hypothetical protein